MANLKKKDGKSVGQDGKCGQQTIEIHDGRFLGGQSHSPDADSWRVSEISNMSDILLIHHEKPENYNQS